MNQCALDRLDDLIFERLQYLFEEADPLIYRDAYIIESEQLGSDLPQHELENRWFLLVIKCFGDNRLASLIEERNTMWEYTNPVTFIKIA